MNSMDAKKETGRNVPALMKYLCALLLFGLNGIVASHIALNSYEIVFLRTLIGSIFLLCIFMAGKGKFHWKEYRRDYVFIVSWVSAFSGFIS